ncbi:MAG TPA: NAD(P)H-dependent oxidoreductase [bacterium]
MAISVILAHPDRYGFNHAIAVAAIEELKRNGHAAFFHDLYEEGFDPVLPSGEIPKGAPLPAHLEAHCREIASAEGIIVIHPNWWGMPPAVMKGWIDRVLRPETAYRFVEGDKGEGVPIGLLKAKAAVVFNTSNTSPEREAGVFKDPLDTLWKNCIFGVCGVKKVHRETFGIVVTSTEGKRLKWLERVQTVVNKYFPPDRK